jgi:uncharacterized protein (TIGR02145 family)
MSKKYKYMKHYTKHYKMLLFYFFTSGTLLLTYNMTKVLPRFSISFPILDPELADIDSTKICDKVWMTHNLNVVTYQNGDSIPQVKDPKAWMALKTGAWCWYDNDSTNSLQYGRLYNWHAVNDSRGLAPQGWHIPSIKEWTDLDTCIGADSLGFRIRGRGWPVSVTNADNSSGFNGLPSGMRTDNGTFRLLGDGAVFWVSDNGSQSETSCYRMVHYVNREKEHLMGTGWGYVSKNEGYSVRCVLDNIPNR